MLLGLRESLKQAMLENRLLEQELNSVKELSVQVARWLMHGPPVEIRRLCRERPPREQDADVEPDTPAQMEEQPRVKRSRLE